MAWCNFREVRDRFTHIDAELVSAKVHLGKGTGEVSVTVRFYP